MATTLHFPVEYENHKYSLIHFKFFVQYAILAGVKVELIKSNDKVFIGDDDKLFFSCLINNTQVIVDYSDHAAKNWVDLYPNTPYFKFQITDKVPGIIPLGPPIVGVKNKLTPGETMRSFMRIRDQYNYTAGDRVLCKQHPNGAATERRNYVHSLISENFNNNDINADSAQIDFWLMHQKNTIGVCVPGATNNMIDRGQMELFGLGVCTVSPKLETMLPFYKKMTPGVHYIQCKDDYSDLVQVLNHSINHLDECNQIGGNAREFFEQYFLPKRYWSWILNNL